MRPRLPTRDRVPSDRPCPSVAGGRTIHGGGARCDRSGRDGVPGGGRLGARPTRGRRLQTLATRRPRSRPPDLVGDQPDRRPAVGRQRRRRLRRQGPGGVRHRSGPAPPLAWSCPRPVRGQGRQAPDRGLSNLPEGRGREGSCGRRGRGGAGALGPDLAGGQDRRLSLDARRLGQGRPVGVAGQRGARPPPPRLQAPARLIYRQVRGPGRGHQAKVLEQPLQGPYWSPFSMDGILSLTRI